MTIRADFNFKDDAQKIKVCKGYVIGDFTPTQEGGNFRPEKVIVQKLIATAPDFDKIEQLAIQHCKVLYDDAGVEEVPEKHLVEACKVCDNNCGYCRFNCNCYTLVEA